MSSSPAQFYLIDGSSYLFRAYYAIRHLSTSDGFPTNAVYGFTSMLLKILRQDPPDFLAVVFDTKATTFRKEMYPEYKANRSAMPEDMVPQLPVIKEIIRGFNISVLELDGFEADDIIATLADKYASKEMEVTIVSGDKDLMQLASESVKILDTMKNSLSGPAEVVEKFGVPPEKLGDVLGLAGDSSDNIPGVPGVGMKTASTLVQQFGSLEEVLSHVDQVTGKKRQENLREFAEQARLSRTLVELERQVPLEVELETLARTSPNDAVLTDLFKRMEFHSLVQEFSASLAQEQAAYRTVLTEAGFVELLDELDGVDRLCLDTETTSLDAVQADLVGLSLSWQEGAAVYIPVGHRYLGAPEQLSVERVIEGLRPFLEDPAVTKIGQNLKYDALVLRRAGLVLQGPQFDTMVASYLLYPGANSHGLDTLAAEHLGHRMTPYAEVAGSGRQQINFSEVEIEKALDYAAEDAEVTLRLANRFASELVDPVKSLFETVEMPLVEVLTEMEWRGVRIDVKVLAELSREMTAELDRLEAHIHELAGTEFNIGSPKQLGHVLFEKMGLPKGKKTKTGWSTNVEVLSKLAQDHEIAAKILDFRSLSKLKGTYSEALPKLVNPETGRIHASFNQAVTATGRLSSSHPNLQNIPIRTDAGKKIRAAFIPAEDHLLVAADYSQIELRVMAHMAEEEGLQQAFAANEDIHQRTASEIFGVFPEAVSAEMRRQAKVINFGVLYGMGAYSLAKELNIGRKDAQHFIDQYFDRYRGVKTFIDRQVEQVREKGYALTLLGRRCAIPEIHSKNGAVRSYGERNAVNYPIQGTAADIIKVAMVHLHRRLQQEEIGARMVIQVHDELVFDVPASQVDALRSIVKAEMEAAVELSVPLVADVGIGENWCIAH